MEIKPLAETGFNVIYNAFQQAFVDYELQLNKAELQAMLKRRGFNPALSFAAFKGNEIVAFTLNGIGTYNGIPTAYDTGTGTLKEYRGKGLATQIFQYSIPYLKEKGIVQYLLEVLQHNTIAVSVYKKLGFEITREFNYFRAEIQSIRNEIKMPEFPCLINAISIEEFGLISDFWEFYPSWQNSFESIRRALADFVSLGVFIENKLTGYCVFEPVSGDITQIAVDKHYRRKGIASLLLDEMMRLNKFGTVKIINTDVQCSSIIGFLKSKKIELQGKQFEMIKKI